MTPCDAASRLRVALGTLAVAFAVTACGPVSAPTQTEALAESQPRTATLPWQEATLTVGAEPQQHFAGFGFSFDQESGYPQLSDADRAEVDRLLYDELDTRIVRLWYTVGQPERMRDVYRDGGIIGGALANGVSELLLGPGNYVGDPEEQAQLIARDIRTFRDEYGVRVTATGVINEPGDQEWNEVPESHWMPLALAMRRELDRAGLDDVTVLGPEFASADSHPIRWFDTIAGESEALASIDALATHSYNMAATPELAERVRAHDKDYWMTEAGGGIIHGSAEHDFAFAADAAARFLNDLNHGVTHWVWFLGLGEGAQDVYQKLVMCDPDCARPGRIYPNAAWHYLRLVTSAFPPGTELRQSTSDLPDWRHMAYSYGPKPPLNAAAGVRPDGRWVLAAVNDTSGASWAHGSYDAPANYRITFEVPELADAGSRAFEVCRASSEVARACDETVEMSEGRLTVEVASLEVVTLVAREPARQS